MEFLKRIANILAVGANASNSGQLYALLRPLLVAVGTLLSLVGIAWLSPEKINYIIQLAQAIGAVGVALSAFVAALMVIVPPLVASFTASPSEQIKKVGKIAADPSAPLAEKAKDTLIDATINLPQVEKIIAEPATAAASSSDDVVSSDQVKVIENVSGLETKKQGS